MSIAGSTNSRMSLYEFHQPKQEPIDAESISIYDYPVFFLSASVFASSVLYLFYGGIRLLSRPDVRKHSVNSAAIAAAALSFPFMLITGAIALERKLHELKQRRKHIKKSRSSWSKRPILLFATFLAWFTAFLWGAGFIGMIVVHTDYEPHTHRHLRNRPEHVGFGKDWKKGEKLGAAIFTSQGGILQIPVILSMVTFVLSATLAIVQLIQYRVSRPKIRDREVVDPDL
ncbi:hypothetical protein CC2G_004906 [Coprinopsis cinerea AmutBmut pab1-1]|nr:hypothetical protein CC2G_004906 [Coprinopsis cinerea AmutBmut pab1-1]